MLTVAPARRKQDIDPWPVVTICFFVAAGFLRGPSRGVSQLGARGAVLARILALLCCVSTASGATGPPIVASQGNLDPCVPGASSTGCAPGLWDLCILSDEYQLPTTSCNHGGGCDSIGGRNISSMSLDVNSSTGGCHFTAVGAEPGAPMGPELCLIDITLMEYDLASREVAVVETRQQVAPLSDMEVSTRNRTEPGGPQAVRRGPDRAPPAISWNSAHHLVPSVNHGHHCTQEISRPLIQVFSVMTSPRNDITRGSDPLCTDSSGARAPRDLVISFPAQITCHAHAQVGTCPARSVAPRRRLLRGPVACDLIRASLGGRTPTASKSL